MMQITISPRILCGVVSIILYMLFTVSMFIMHVCADDSDDKILNIFSIVASFSIVFAMLTEVLCMFIG